MVYPRRRYNHLRPSVAQILSLLNIVANQEDRWPSMSDRTWATGVHKFYGTTYSAE